MADDLFADIPSEAGADIFADIPVPKGRPGVRAALKEIYRLQSVGGRTRPRSANMSDIAANSMLMGLPTQTNAAVGALLTGAKNIASGNKKAPYTAKDMYDAVRLYENAQRATYAKEHPGRALTGEVMGALAMPGGKQVGEWIAGKVAPTLVAQGRRIPAGVRAGQGLRLAASGAAQQGTYQAATARPGEEVEQAKSGALTGAVAAPLTAVGASKAAEAVPAVARAVVRTVKPRAPGEVALDRLVATLRKEQLDPSAVEAALTEWRRAGGITPTLIDILHDAGASGGVYKLLAKSSTTAATRQLAEKYAAETVGSAQRRAVEQARRLPSGEPRTPQEVRQQLGEQRAAVEKQAAERTKTVTRRGDVKARAVEARGEKKVAEITGRDTTPVLEPLPEGAPRNTGAEQFVRELNSARDAAQDASDAAFEKLNSVPPDAAVVAPEAVAETLAALRAGMGPNPNLTLKGMQSLKGTIDAIEKELEGGGPLTVKRLLDLREKLNEVMDEHRGAKIAANAFGIKKQIDATLDNLLEKNQIVGDPAVIDMVREANSLYSDLQTKFGSGLPAKLTERKPGKPFETVVDPVRAGDEIFTAENLTPRGFDKIGQEMGDAMELVSPEAQAALKAEALSRAKPEVLPELLKSPYADVLLPRDVAETSVAAQAANAERTAAAQAAEEAKVPEIEAAKAATAERKALTEGTTEARLAEVEKARQTGAAPVEATEQALATGEAALKTPSEEFAPQVGSIEDVNLPVAQSGGRQAVIDFLEANNPESTARIKTLGSERALANLSQLYGPEEVARFQERLRQIAGQGQRARELASAVQSNERFGSTALEDIQPQNVAYLSGRVELALEALRGMGRLTPEQQAAALKLLTGEGDLGVLKLVPKLRRRYLGVGSRTGAALARPLAPQGDDLETMKLDYGIE